MNGDLIQSSFSGISELEQRQEEPVSFHVNNIKVVNEWEAEYIEIQGDGKRTGHVEGGFLRDRLLAFQLSRGRNSSHKFVCITGKKIIA
jgi:hypothetical protein